MRLLACCLTLSASAALAAPASRGAGPPPGVAAAAEALADALGPPAEGRRAVALALETRAPPLAAPLEASLAAALARRGWAVTPLRGAPDPEPAARAAGQDWLLRIQAGLVPGRRELLLVGEAIPTWSSFFLQRRPAARPVPPRVLSVRLEADAETLALAREGRPPGAPFAAVRPLARVPGRVLALAVGEVPEARGAAIALATEDEDLLLDAAGARVASRAAPGGRRPVRTPAAALAIGDYGGGRIAVQRAGAARAEVLGVRRDRLEPVATLEAAPLCAAEGTRLFGAFLPGKAVLADVLSTTADPAARPRSPRALYRVAAAPRGGPVAVGALSTDGALELLRPDLAPAAPPLEGVGAGFALADLDGDGTAEVVASALTAAPPDRLRVLAVRGGAPLLEAGPLPGLLLAGAAGDLTGDGIDDALLAEVEEGPDGPHTTLLLVTADPREVAR